PLVKPNLPADLDLKLAAGSYRFVLLPQPVDVRALVLLEPRPEPREVAGHGPLPLPLETPVGHLWVEPELPEGAAPESVPRPPDGGRSGPRPRAPAAAGWPEERRGRTPRLDGPAGGPEIGAIPPGRAWKGELPAGRYQVAAECSRRNSRVHYKITVHTEE